MGCFENPLKFKVNFQASKAPCVSEKPVVYWMFFTPLEADEIEKGFGILLIMRC